MELSLLVAALQLKNLDFVILESDQLVNVPVFIAGVNAPPPIIAGVTPNLRLYKGNSTPEVNLETKKDTLILAP